MSDARSRALERGATGEGDLGARVAVLVDRLRRGALSDERLRCAAFLGDEAAVIVARERGLSLPVAPSEFTEWHVALERLGTTVSLHAGYALTLLFHPFWLRSPLGGDPRAALNTIEDMLTCPCDSHALAADRAWRGIRPQRPSPGPISALAYVATSCVQKTAMFAAAYPFPVMVILAPPGTAERFCMADSFDAEMFTPCLDDMRGHLSRCLMPWALASTDAVVEAEGANELRTRLLDLFDETSG